jgi:hypothetical protein
MPGVLAERRATGFCGWQVLKCRGFGAVFAKAVAVELSRYS